MAQNGMRVWLEAATREELDKLGSISKRTVATIRQIAGGYRTKGAARTTPEVARDIELATIKMQRQGLPIVRREDLCPACAKCEYMKAAKKEAKNGEA
jgi:hypothetical protein